MRDYSKKIPVHENTYDLLAEQYNERWRGYLDHQKKVLTPFRDVLRNRFDEEIIRTVFEQDEEEVEQTEEPKDDAPKVNPAVQEFSEKLIDYSHSIYDLLHQYNVIDIKESVIQMLERSNDPQAELAKYILQYQ